MKKILFFLLAFFAITTVVSCSKDDDDNNADSEVARVKAAAIGTWVGEARSLIKDPRTVTVTITANKFTTTEPDGEEGVSLNITQWYYNTNNHYVYMQLDDEMKTAIPVQVQGNTMTLVVDTQLLFYIPENLTKK
jgi:hypothetical protein